MSENDDAEGFGEAAGDGLPIYPLVPGQRLDSRHYVPWYFDRFLTSHFVATVDPAAGFHAIILWSEALRQDPAGTLPEDDRELARLAGFGRDVAGWREVREGALYGWSPCLVGEPGAGQRRLMHRTIAEVAVGQVDAMAKSRAEVEAGVERSRLSRLRELMRRAGCNKRMIDDDQVLERVDRHLAAHVNGRRTVDAVRAAVERVSMSDTVVPHLRPVGDRE